MSKQKPTPKPSDIFQLAERLIEASKILDNAQANGDAKYGSAPMLIVDSLAVELYLKCLYVQDHNKAPYEEHSFKKLFHSLNDGTRKAIRHQFDQNIKDVPVLRNLNLINPDAVKVTDLTKFLRVASETFETTRYLYEDKKTPNWFYTHLFRDVLRKVIQQSVGSG